MIAPALLLVAFLQFPAAPQNSLAGSWVNQDAATMGLTRIFIGPTAHNSFKVHVWGSCEPDDCDWGEREIETVGSGMTVTFDTDFSTTTIQLLLLSGERMRAIYETKFKDGSGRTDQEHTAFFISDKANAGDAESLAASTLLQEVAERYRSLREARFEAEVHTEYKGGEAVSRRTKSLKIEISQPDRAKTDVIDSDESKVIIQDGKTIWTFYPKTNEYSLATTRIGISEDSPVQAYSSLDEIRGSMRIVGREQVADAYCVKLVLERGPKHVRTLWIDPQSKFVRRDEIEDVSVISRGEQSQNSMTTYSVARIVEKLSPDIFSFDPVKTHATKRIELQQNPATTSIGTRAPDFSLKAADGREVRLSGLHGKIVLLDFWASWCLPCRSAMPAIELLHRQFKDNGVVVLGIDDEEIETQRAYREKFGYSFSSLLDPAKKVKNLYKVGGIPTTVLIDGNGGIRAYEVGETSYESLTTTLRSILANESQRVSPARP